MLKVIVSDNHFQECVSFSSKIYLLICLFAYLKEENFNSKRAVVILVGAEKKERIEKRPFLPAEKGSHKNYKIPYGELVPIEKILKEYSKKIKK